MMRVIITHSIGDLDVRLLTRSVVILGGGQTDWGSCTDISIEICFIIVLERRIKISFGTFDLSAGELRLGVGILESSEMSSANVSGESPFTPPNFHWELVEFLCGFLEGIAVVLSSHILGVLRVPCKITMMIDSYLVYVIRVKKIVPSGPVTSETLLEDKVGLRSVLLDEFSSLSVEVLKNNFICLEWLVDGLKGNQSRVRSPFLEERLSLIEGPSEMSKVHRGITEASITMTIKILIPDVVVAIEP
jgi:hypothetical protein